MSTDIEQRVRSGLADAPTPVGLRLDADAVTRAASRRHRHRRTGQALLGGMASIAVLGSVTWAGGWLPGEVQRVLPASPWSSCPISGFSSGERTVRLAALDHATIPLSGGGTVVAGLAQGCPDGDYLLMSPTASPPHALPETVPLQGAMGADANPHMDPLASWWQGLQLPDGRQMTGVMVPHGAEDLVRVGPDDIHEPSSEPVRVPGTDYAAFVLEDYWPDGEDLAQVWRGADGLVHTSWGAGITSRVWQGDDPAADLTDTWVGQDRQDRQWVMRDGVVQGPFPVSIDPYAVAFTTEGADQVELVVVVPEASGELALEDGSGAEALWLDSSEGGRTLRAALVTLDRDESGEPLALHWRPAGEGATAQQVPVLQP